MRERKDMLKTMTLTDENGDQPSMVACLGHVSEAQFNEAFYNEGWSEKGNYRFDDEYNPLRHEYWVTSEDPDVPWQKSVKDEPSAEPVTVVNWD